jgi:hypothetical protein
LLAKLFVKSAEERKKASFARAHSGSGASAGANPRTARRSVTTFEIPRRAIAKV